jgi:uncharacterized protein YndB with AHSA1/START domain
VSTFKTSRAFSAPPEAVFDAFSDPARLARWWGPDGFSNTFETFDFKPGGLWNFIMHGPDGANYPNHSTFVSIEPALEVVIKHLSEPRFLLTIRLESMESGTRVNWEQAFEVAEVAASICHIAEPANEQNLSRWAAEIARHSRSSI